MSVVVAVLLVIGGGVFLLNGGDDGTEAGRGDKGAEKGTGQGGAEAGKKSRDRLGIAWEVDVPDLSGYDSSVMESHGTWLVGGNLVAASFDAVTAYDMKTGEKAWSMKMDRGPRCAAAPDVSGDKSVLLWGRKCEKIMGIDLVDGRELWRADLPSEGYGATEYNSAEMAVSGNTAAAAWNGDAVGYDLTTGKKLWQTEKNSECWDRSYVGGPQLVAKVECDSGRKHSLQAVEADGGKGWEWKAPDGVRITRVFSVDPVVVGVMSGDAYEITEVMVLDDGGKLRSKISIPEKSHMFDCEGTAQAGCFNTIVDKANDALCLKTYIRPGEDGSTTDIAAYDMATGKRKWVSAPVRKYHHASPLAMQEGRLLGYEQSPTGEASRITSIDPETGKATSYAELPGERWGAQRGMTANGSGRPYWKDGRLFLVAHSFYGEADLNHGHILAFG